jgi:L-2,4-diaminobutyrate decarboxylase
MIEAHPAFELGVQPETNIVCFTLKATQNTVIEDIRHQLLQDGKFYIVQTVLNKQTYFRVSIMNPLTTTQDLADLLEEILRILQEKMI